MRFDNSVLQQCWFLAGPTASGKTSVGLLVAERLGAEIVAMDSMSLYRGMDIGTAKPTPTERVRVPHHLIDVLDPDEEFSVADYVLAAEAVARGVLERGRIPLFVGGTGLYLRTLLRGVFDGPGADHAVRRRIEAQAAAEGHGWLHRRLQSIDPAAAARLHPHDTRRL
ncbi:MAG: tRNA (adenosine(37)-N6)-dimethylallyltransferase MiaA, partial [Planctomycetaceae bacterium]